MKNVNPIVLYSALPLLHFIYFTSSIDIAVSVRAVDLSVLEHEVIEN
jgi:hypothetical protein